MKAVARRSPAALQCRSPFATARQWACATPHRDQDQDRVGPEGQSCSKYRARQCRRDEQHEVDAGGRQLQPCHPNRPEPGRAQGDCDKLRKHHQINQERGQAERGTVDGRLVTDDVGQQRSGDAHARRKTLVGLAAARCQKHDAGKKKVEKEHPQGETASGSNQGAAGVETGGTLIEE
jgi:hypothetical protein